MSAELTAAEAATVERFEQAPDALVEDLRDEVAGVAVSALWNVSHLPEWMQVPALGRDMRPLGDLMADALLPLIAQREAAARAEALRDAADAWDDRSEANLDALKVMAVERYHPGGPSMPAIWLRDLAARFAQGGTS